jgi:hypothetical protein
VLVDAVEVKYFVKEDQQLLFLVIWHLLHHQRNSSKMINTRQKQREIKGIKSQGNIGTCPLYFTIICIIDQSNRSFSSKSTIFCPGNTFFSRYSLGIAEVIG